jgi:mono/diheme cytochrome c family protein
VRSRLPTILAALAIAIATATACSEEKEVGGDPAVARGRQVYLGLCTACHNADPAKDGTAGPAIAGSSRELLEARVVHGGYPPGYTPKRPSQIMPRFPQLAGEIDALHAFLNAEAR